MSPSCYRAGMTEPLPIRRLLLLPFLALAGCSQAIEGRIVARLTEAGLSRPMAECMAERWVERLSVAQLRKLQTLADGLAEEGPGLTPGRLADSIRRVDDPEMLRVVTGSTVACALTS